MANYIFKTPTVNEAPIGKGRLFMRFKLTRGISIVKINGAYAQQRVLNAEDLPTYQEYYLGGGTHTVNDTQRTALIAANIGITSSNFTVI